MKKRSICLLSMMMLLPLIGACAQNGNTSNNENNSINKNSSTIDSSSSIVEKSPAITDADFLAAGYLFKQPKMMKDKGIGEEVSLRGTNVGSLFVQENWMTVTNASCQIETINVLTNRFGIFSFP